MKIEDYGRNGFGGWWDPWGRCWSVGGGPYHYTYGEIVYNSWYTDRHGGRVDGYVVSPGHLPSLTMHDAFHSIGGDHLALHTTNPPSKCNLSYESVDPFTSGRKCEPMADLAKPGDIAELQRHYPLPMPGASHSHLVVARGGATLQIGRPTHLSSLPRTGDALVVEPDR